MSDIIGISTVAPVMYGVLKITWTDGFEGIVDLRPVIEKGQLFEFLRQEPDRFQTVQLGEYGHDIHWLDDDGDEIDLGSDSLRQRAVRQAEILRLAS